MDGYSVDDTYLEIDHEIEQESDIIKIKLKKDGSPYSNAKVISHDELDTLLQEITLHIQSLYQQMITGDIRIYPTRSIIQTLICILILVVFVIIKPFVIMIFFIMKIIKLN